MDVIPLDQVDEDISGTPDFSSSVIPLSMVDEDIAAPEADPSLIAQFGGNVWEGVKETPAVLAETVGSIPSGISNLSNLPGDLGYFGKEGIKQAWSAITGDPYIPSGTFEELEERQGRSERTLRGVGNISTLVGATKVAGPFVGAVGGQTLFDKLLQIIGIDPETTAEEDFERLGKNTGTFGTLGIAGKVVEGGVGKVGPQTKSRASQTAAKTLATVSETTPERLRSALEVLKDDPLAAQKTTAEVLASPEIATLEQAMGTVKPTEMAAAQGARTVASNKLLEDMAGKGALPENTGQLLQEAIQGAKEGAKENIKAAYDAVPQNLKINADPIAADALAAIDRYWGKGSPKFPAQLEALIEPIASGGALTVGELQNVRSHLSAFARNALKNPEMQRQGAIATAVSESIAKTIGESPEAAGLWKAANDLRAEFSQQFGKGPLTKIDQALPSGVLKKILDTPESAQKAYNILGKNKGAMGAIRDQIGTDLLNKSDAQRIKFISDNASELKTLLSKDDYKVVEAIKNDAQSRISSQKSANPTLGSNTALKLSNVVERALTGKDNVTVKPGIWAQITSRLVQGSGIGLGAYATYTAPQVAIPAMIGTAITKGLRGRSASLVQDALYKQLKDPQTFLKELEKVTKKEGNPIRQAIKSVLGRSGLGPAMDDEIDLKQSLNNVLGDQAVDKVQVQELDEKEPVSVVLDKIKADPVDHAIALLESDMNPKAKNPDSTASGLFQLIKGTAKNLGVKDVFNAAENYNGYQKLKKEAIERFGSGDLETIYSAHYLGAPVYQKVLDGEPLTETQAAQVKYLRSVLLPRLEKIYGKLVKDTDITQA